MNNKYEKRFALVKEYLLQHGLQVVETTHTSPPFIPIPVVVVRKFDLSRHIQCPYEPGNYWERLWALIIAARSLLRSHEIKSAEHQVH